MRISIVVLIIVVAVGGSVIAFGFLTNQEQEMPQDLTPFEKLQNYKEELEKINQYNQNVLDELEQSIADSDNIEGEVDLEQLQEEIKVLKRVIIENEAELEEVAQRLSEMAPQP